MGSFRLQSTQINLSNDCMSETYYCKVTNKSLSFYYDFSM